MVLSASGRRDLAGTRTGFAWLAAGPGGGRTSASASGDVPEDDSADGEGRDHLPHDDARSRACRWGQDGLAGICDIEQRLCPGLALRNGRDPILHERVRVT